MCYDLIKTQDGSYTLKNIQYDEPYHSFQGALYEAQNLYIKQSNIEYFLLTHNTACILDVGLGLGYNALETIKLWFKSDTLCTVQMISVEKDVKLFNYFRSGNAPWMLGWDEFSKSLSSSLKQVSSEIFTVEFKHPYKSCVFEWVVILNDALNIDFSMFLKQPINFIWHDPFSYKNNPQLWDENWFKNIKEYCDSNVILLTYSVAKVVRLVLEKAGWKYNIIKTTGLKRNWLKAALK